MFGRWRHKSKMVELSGYIILLVETNEHEIKLFGKYMLTFTETICIPYFNHAQNW